MAISIFRREIDTRPAGLSDYLAPGALLFHVGFFTLAVQSLLAREFLILYLGSEVALGVFYAAWLLWIAAGAALYLPFTKRRGMEDVRAAGGDFILKAGLALLPLAALAETAFLRWSRYRFEESAAELVPFGKLALATFAATFFVGLPAGFLFAAACRAVDAARSRGEGGKSFSPDSSKAVGLLFACEALGGFAGGLVYTFLLIERFPTDGVLYLLTALVGLHLFLWAFLSRSRRERVWLALGVVYLVAGLAASVTPWGENRSKANQIARFARVRPGFELLDTTDSRYARLELARRGGQITLFANGKVAFSHPDRIDNRRRAALALAQCPEGARSVLLLGSSEPGLIEEILGHPFVQRLDAVVLDPRIAPFVEGHLDPRDLEILQDPRVRLHPVDPRAFVNRRMVPGAPYDLVLVEAPDPTSASVNRLFTVEFYENLARHMKPDGAVVTSVLSSANYLGREVADYAGSVVATVRSVFPHAVLTPGDRMTILASASDGRVGVDAVELARRYRAFQLGEDHFRPEAFATLLPPHDVRAVAERFAGLRAPLNTDARPMTYYLAMKVWSQLTGASLPRGFFQSLERQGGALLLLPLLVFLAGRLLYIQTGRRRTEPLDLDRFNAAVTVGGLGCLGMAASMMLLLAYQCSVGYLYGRIGLLAALFMIGLGFGAVAARIPAVSTRFRARLALMLVLGVMTLLFILTGRILESGGGRFAGAAIMILLALTGTLVGAAFSAAGHVFSGVAARAGAWLDAADHAGGALGAVATAGVAVPLLGFRSTSLLAAGIAAGLLALNAQAFWFARSEERRRAKDLAECDEAIAKRLAAERLRPWAWAMGTLLAAAYLTGFWTHRTVEDSAPAPAAIPQVFLKEWSQIPLEEKETDQTQSEPGQTFFSWSERSDPFRHWVPDTAGVPPAKRAAFATDQTASDVRGYGGPIVLALDLTGERALHIRLLDHNETPAYVTGLEEWLAGLKGFSTERALVLGRDVDGITGATATCRAALAALNQSVYVGGTQLFGKRLDPANFHQTSWMENLLRVDSIALGLCFLIFVPVYFLCGDRGRFVFLVFVVLALGFYYNSAFTILDVGDLSMGRWPSPANAPGLVLLAGVGQIRDADAGGEDLTVSEVVEVPQVLPP